MNLSAHDSIWRWTAGMKISDENHFIEITQEKFQIQIAALGTSVNSLILYKLCLNPYVTIPFL